MKIQLVNSPLPNFMSSCLRSQCYPPLNLISLSTHIAHNFSNISVEILDGEILGLDKLLEMMDADIVGISSNSLSYESAVYIAKHLKAKTPTTPIILGGAHASHAYREILVNQNCFDFVVIGQGEQAIVDILNGRSKELISNLAYIKNGKIIRNKSNFIDINSLYPPDFSRIELIDYFANFSNHYNAKKEKRGIPVQSSTGCSYRMNHGGCIYCSIPNLKHTLIDPKKYWDSILKLNCSTNADFFWDISDTFTSNIDWLEELAEKKPSKLKIDFHVYARIDNINERTLNSLKIIGVKEVLIGIESFNDEMLETCNKGIDNHQINTSLVLLNQYGIDVAVSFVLGLPNESDATLAYTLEQLRGLNWMDNIIENHASVLIPLPGSRIFNQILANSKFREKYLGKDIINLFEFQKDYLNEFTKCGADKVYEYYLEIDKLFQSAGPFFIDKRAPIYKQINFKEELYYI
jgi:radical SAM superfamily enzyme YgiQ (UPF0313 family)